jgi:beta-lactamase superfamily II metal-dependent hydrolase
VKLEQIVSSKEFLIGKNDMSNGYTIDFVGVGEESKSGDCIIIQFGDFTDATSLQTIVVDGGFKSSFEKVSEHLKNVLQITKIDLVVSTHPDRDHVGGLIPLLEEFDVSELWMHLPWAHNDGLAAKFIDGRITDASIAERLRKSLQTAYDLQVLAEQSGCRIKEPFSGLSFGGCFTVVGPSQEYYEELIPQFDGMPAQRTAMAYMADRMAEGIRALKKMFATWGVDQVDDDDTTSARNNSSVISVLEIEDRKIILTADAGITALDAALDYIDQRTGPLSYNLVQIPHHGSRRNIGPSVLTRLLGGPVAEGTTTSVTTCISAAPKGSPKHPHQAVVNAVIHRGGTVNVTRGCTLCFSYNAVQRSGWGAISSEQYAFTYEAEE